MWVRAVWYEGSGRNEKEMEKVVPASWVKGDCVYWPAGASAQKAYENQISPGPKWRQFKLKKIKIRSDSLQECEAYDDTTTVESEEEEDPGRKRTRKKRVFEDFEETGTNNSHSMIQEELTTEDNRSCSNQDVDFPLPPKKVKPSLGAGVSPSARSPSPHLTSSSTQLTHTSLSTGESRSQTHTSLSRHNSRSPTHTSLSRNKSRSPSHMSTRESRSPVDKSQCAHKSGSRSLSHKLQSVHESRSPSHKLHSAHQSKSHSQTSQFMNESQSSKHKSASANKSGSLSHTSQSTHKSRSHLPRAHSAHKSKSPSHSSQSKHKSRSPIHRSQLTHRSRSPIHRSQSTHRSESPIHRSRSTHGSRSSIHRSRSTHRSRSAIHRSQLTHRSRSPIHRSQSTHGSRSAIHRSQSTHRSKSPIHRSQSTHQSKSPIHRSQSTHRSRSAIHRSPTTHRSGSPIHKSQLSKSRSQSRESSYSRRSFLEYSLFGSSTSRSSSVTRSYRSKSRSRSPFSNSHSPLPHLRHSTPKDTRRKTDVYPIPDGRFQKRVLFLLAEIREDVASLKQRGGGMTEARHTEEIVQAQTMEDFYSLDTKSKVPEERQKMIQILSMIGGVNIKDSVKKIMERLMTNELMSRFNMKGGKQKMAFKSTSVCGLVIASFMKTNNGATEQLALDAVAVCLKYAPDRRGGGGRQKNVASV